MSCLTPNGTLLAAQSEQKLTQNFVNTVDQWQATKLPFMQMRIGLRGSGGKRLKLEPKTPFLQRRDLFSN
jgi:hypothetical protein